MDLCLVGWGVYQVARRVHIDLCQVIRGNGQGELSLVALKLLCLAHNVLELTLLELEMFFIESGLFRGQARRLALDRSWALKDEALIYIAHKVVVYLELINLRESGSFSGCNRHPICDFLALVDHLALESFGVHGLIQNFLNVH